MTITPNHALPIDHFLDLVSDTLVNSYCFRSTGRVTATIGKKNGPLAGPLFNYRVVSDDGIEIIHSDGRIERWTGIRIEGGLLHVERDGQLQTFTIRKPAP
ncbi:hypothetical protein [Variovorax sp. YR634]|jgi:hypothetical protein|uniref:hypothetical protein n=1 Tax=unclassified Variovorax TaxID=663243 RepID=UPI00089AC2CD|nr:hypothetical protein [Variovorax sp. YR634]SDX88826.1 hypothetical protein SAMN05518669_107203 [Variovorax sp. YR634]